MGERGKNDPHKTPGEIFGVSPRQGMMRMMKQNLLFLAVLLFVFLAAGCEGGEDVAFYATPSLSYSIDPVFREFYNYRGGESRLGKAISPPFQEGRKTVQFVEAGKMIFNPDAPVKDLFRMAPLGVEMWASEPPVEPPAHPGLHYIAGHIIFPDFYPLYEQLGAQMVGKPLTEVKFNPIRQRYEQYFENLGFYRLIGSSEVRLLSYGVWACKERCSLTEPTWRDSIIDTHSVDVIDPTFKPFVTEKGIDFTGSALETARRADDGKWEQILENIVLVAEAANQSESVALRPVSEMLNILPDAPRPYSGDPNNYFYPAQDSNLGYEIPNFFWEYIEKHGNIAVFGAPITHYTPFDQMRYHQCFQNLCLFYDPGAPEGARIRPEPLGYAYKVLYGKPALQPTPVPTLTLAPTRTPEPPLTVTLEPAPASPSPLGPEQPPQPPGIVVPGMREIAMQVWERYTVVKTLQSQEIGVWILENNHPMVGQTAELTLKLPDGSEQVYTLAPTDLNGQTSITLPAIEAPNGALIYYKACVPVAADLRTCIADYFVIWNTP
jgi:hypothetical protein